MLDDNFWGPDSTSLLMQREVGRLYVEVYLTADKKKWPDFWGPEAIWDHPELCKIVVRHIANDKWGRLSGFHLIEVYAEFYDSLTPRSLLPGIISPYVPTSGQYLSRHKVTGAWGPYRSGKDEIEGALPGGMYHRRTESTEDDLTWIFNHWRPDQHRYGTFEKWWGQAQRNLPKRNIHPDDYDLIERAARRALVTFNAPA